MRPMRSHQTRALLRPLLVILALASGGCVGKGPVVAENPLTDPASGPPAGNPDGDCAIPDEAGLEDVSSPTTVVGDGSP
jgi:hypothetical protein